MSQARIRLHRLAAREYREAFGWYAKQRPVAAERFAIAINEVVQRIATFPAIGTPYRGAFRWVKAKRFDYVIFYRIVSADEVRVQAIAHGRRRPDYWVRRNWS